MRWAFGALCGALTLAGCGEHAANPYPEDALARFEQSCPPASEVCTCTWDKITRDMTYEDYEAALDHFRETGQMDPRVTHARTICLEKHPS